MFSIYTKEKLKKWSYLGLLITTTIAAASLSGLSMASMGYLVAFFAIPSLPMILFRYDLSALVGYMELSNLKEPKEREQKRKKLLADDKYLPIKVFLPLILMLAIAGFAYLHTANLLFSLFLFASSFISARLTSESIKIKALTFIFKYSSSRSLDLNNAKEAEFYKTLKELCEKMQKPVPRVSYINILAKVDLQDFNDFKDDAAKIFPKIVKGELSNEECLKKIKRKICPNMFAMRSLFDGTEIVVNSNIFEHDVKFTRAEIEGVLAHELGHHTAHDSFGGLLKSALFEMTVSLGLSSFRFVGLILILIARFAQAKLDHSAETMADLHAVNLAGPQGLVSFMNKIEKLETEIKAEETKTPSQGSKGWFSQWQSHPETQDRITKINEYAEELKSSEAPASGFKGAGVGASIP